MHDDAVVVELGNTSRGATRVLGLSGKAESLGPRAMRKTQRNKQVEANRRADLGLAVALGALKNSLLRGLCLLNTSSGSLRLAGSLGDSLGRSGRLLCSLLLCWLGSGRCFYLEFDAKPSKQQN